VDPRTDLDTVKKMCALNRNTKSSPVVQPCDETVQIYGYLACSFFVNEVFYFSVRAGTHSRGNVQHMAIESVGCYSGDN
jgi:hypothetical protein